MSPSAWQRRVLGDPPRTHPPIAISRVSQMNISRLRIPSVTTSERECVCVYQTGGKRRAFVCACFAKLKEFPIICHISIYFLLLPFNVKGIVHWKNPKFTHSLLTPMSLEALLTFANPHQHPSCPPSGEGWTKHDISILLAWCDPRLCPFSLKMAKLKKKLFAKISTEASWLHSSSL